MAMNLHKGDNVNRLHSKVIDTIPYIFKKSPDESLKIKTKHISVGIKRNPGKNKFIKCL